MQSVEAGGFRADLAYRLSGCVITLPPLRARRDDIALLAEHFGASAGARPIRFTADALQLLTSYPWPGNVRELRLFVERAALLADGPIVTSRDVQRDVQTIAPAAPAPGTMPPTQTDAARSELLRLLDEAGWNTTQLSAQLGLHRSTLYRRMARLGIAPRRSVSGAASGHDTTAPRQGDDGQRDDGMNGE